MGVFVRKRSTSVGELFHRAMVTSIRHELIYDFKFSRGIPPRSGIGYVPRIADITDT